MVIDDDIPKYIRSLIKQQNSLDVGIHEVIIYDFSVERKDGKAKDLMDQLVKSTPEENPIVLSTNSEVSGRSGSFRIIISDSHQFTVPAKKSSNFWEISSKYIFLPISPAYSLENFLEQSEYFRQHGVLDFIAITNPSPGKLEIFTHNPFFNKTEIFREKTGTISSIFPDKLKDLNQYEYQTIFLTQPGYLDYTNKTLSGVNSFFFDILLEKQNARFNVKNYSNLYDENFSVQSFQKVFDAGDYDLVLCSQIPRTENISEPICTYEPQEYCIGVPEKQSRISFDYFLVNPFPIEVWIMILVTVLLSALFWWFVSWRRIIRNPDSSGRIVFSIFGWFVGQDVGQRRLTLAQKCLAQLLIFSLFFLSNLYTSELLSLQAVQREVSDISNFDDIVKHQLPIFTSSFFYDNYVQNNSGFNPEFTKLMSRQTQAYKAYGAIMEKQAILARCLTLKTAGDGFRQAGPDYKTLDQKFTSNFEYYFYHKLNPFRNKIKYYTDLVFESGLTHYYHLQHDSPTFKPEDSKDSGTLIGFGDLYLTFLIYLGGCLLATLVFIGEIIWFRISNCIRERREMNQFQYLP
jgi:hypothetical protein